MAFINKNTALALAALIACGTAVASEDYDLRYAPGIGGADMSAPFEGGWVFQLPVYVYSGNIRSTSVVPTDLSAAFGAPAGTAGALTTISSNTQINVHGFLPRLSFMSATTFLGATVGGTALIPLVNKDSNVRVTSIGTTLTGAALGLPAANQAGLVAEVNGGATPQADALASGNSARTFGLGDLEVSPILRWSTEATQTLFVMTVVMPTGDYEKQRAANPSAGHFYTFRPAVQWSYIGEGWDFGARGAYSYNTKNTETQYKTGSYVNVDLTAMKSITDSTRVGLSAYAVDQVNKDTTSLSPTEFAQQSAVIQARQEATLDQKGHVYGVGPEYAYIHGAGDYLLEGRIMKEFGAETRPKGFTAIMTLSKPF